MTLLLLAATAWACSCSPDVVTHVPPDGATIPPRPALRVVGYSPEYGAPPRISLHDASGNALPVVIAPLANDAWEVRPERRLRAGEVVQLVVWTGRSFGPATQGARYVVAAGRTAAPMAPVIATIKRYDSEFVTCGLNSWLRLGLATAAPPDTMLGVWTTSDPTAALDYSEPPTDVVRPHGDEVALGSFACRAGGFRLAGGSVAAGRGAVRLGLRLVDDAGRWSPPVEIDVPPP